MKCEGRRGTDVGAGVSVGIESDPASETGAVDMDDMGGFGACDEDSLGGFEGGDESDPARLSAVDPTSGFVGVMSPSEAIPSFASLSTTPVSSFDCDNSAFRWRRSVRIERAVRGGTNGAKGLSQASRGTFRVNCRASMQDGRRVPSTWKSAFSKTGA